MANFLLLREIVERKGVPGVLYSDRHGIFQRSPKEAETMEEQLEGRRHRTQFGRALEEVLCFKYRRTVASDNSVRFNGHSIQLLPGPDRLSYARAGVEVQERLDGSLKLWYQGRMLASREAPAPPAVLRARKGGRCESTPPDRGLSLELLQPQPSPLPEAGRVAPLNQERRLATATSAPVAS